MWRRLPPSRWQRLQGHTSFSFFLEGPPARIALFLATDSWHSSERAKYTLVSFDACRSDVCLSPAEEEDSYGYVSSTNAMRTAPANAIDQQAERTFNYKGTTQTPQITQCDIDAASQ